MQGCFGWKEGRTDAWTGGRRGGEKIGGGRKQGVRACQSADTSRLSVAARARARTGRDARRGNRASGRPGLIPSVRETPPDTSPIPTPLSFLGAWKARASPVDFIFLLICSPFRNSGSTDLSLPPSKKYSVSHRAEAEAPAAGDGSLGPGITSGG